VGSFEEGHWQSLKSLDTQALQLMFRILRKVRGCSGFVSLCPFTWLDCSVIG